jgi:hypothetical protein
MHTSAQVESPVLIMNRGMLWQSVFNGKIGANFNNWARRGIGLDWPGFDETIIAENIGGAPSHLATGGFWVGAKKTRDTILNVEDWSINASTIAAEGGAKYRITKHRHKYRNGANYGLQSNPREGEEVIETQWEYNLNYTNLDDRERQLPLRVTREMHQWSGSRRDENYIIYEYRFRNISPELRAAGRTVPDTLFGFYVLLNYALHVNSRAWSILFPALPPGARNTFFFYDPSRRMVWGRSGDYRDTPSDESFMFASQQGPLVNGVAGGEWLAPGIVGVRLLYATPDSTGQPTRVNKFGWSAASSSIDLSGPFTGIPGTNEAKYAVLANPALASNFVANSADTVFMRRARLWSMMSLGPWTIPPGDSVVVAVAEIVDGADYRYAVIPSTPQSRFSGTAPGQGANIFFATADKAKFTYDQHLAGYGLNHPDPPSAPRFSVDFFRGAQRQVANVIQWGNESEAVPDPDDGIRDLAGYRVYRSTYLPIGPWDTVATVAKGDPQYYNGATGKYTFVDSTVTVSTLYYYALTAFDTGRSSWSVNPSAIHPDSRSTRVLPCESSIFANRVPSSGDPSPFRATLEASANAKDVLMVPNPSTLSQGVQFVNLPNPCTIRIYSIRGDLLATIPVPERYGGLYSWNPITDYGGFIESGIYLFHVESPQGTRIGKFAFVR